MNGGGNHFGSRSEESLGYRRRDLASKRQAPLGNYLSLWWWVVTTEAQRIKRGSSLYINHAAQSFALKEEDVCVQR